MSSLTIHILGFNWFRRILSPRQHVITTSNRHSIIPNTNNSVVWVSYACSNLSAWVFASHGGKESNSHEVFRPLQVILPFFLKISVITKAWRGHELKTWHKNESVVTVVSHLTFVGWLKSFVPLSSKLSSFKDVRNDPLPSEPFVLGISCQRRLV